MTDTIDKRYFLELEEAAPHILDNKSNCKYLSDRHQYSVELWGDHYIIDPEAATVEYLVATGRKVPQYFDLVAFFYLLKTRISPLTGEWVSEKDLPGGPTFFRGPHQIPTSLISNRFENDLQEFRRCCENCGGTPVNLADVAYTFSITPHLPVAVLYWAGDEDFPAEAKILYDASIEQLLSLDIIFALGVGVCSRIGSAG